MMYVQNIQCERIMGEEVPTLFKYLSVGSTRVCARVANCVRVNTQKRQWPERCGRRDIQSAPRSNEGQRDRKHARRVKRTGCRSAESRLKQQPAGRSMGPAGLDKACKFLFQCVELAPCYTRHHFGTERMHDSVQEFLGNI